MCMHRYALKAEEKKYGKMHLCVVYDNKVAGYAQPSFIIFTIYFFSSNALREASF